MDIDIDIDIDMWLMDTINCVRYVYALVRLNRHDSDANIERTKRAAARCGAIGQKLLQFLLSNDGVLPVGCKKKLSYVFEDNDVHDMRDTIAMYREDFGRSLYEDFVVTEEAEVPVGSGTIGQVYKFFHKKLNTTVAVKVKHPGVDKQAQSFSESIHRILWTIEKVYTLPFGCLIKEYISNIGLQLNYAREAESTMQMYANFATEPHIVIPQIHEHSARFIVMSYHTGTPFDELSDSKMKKMVSIDIYLFMMACTMQCDLIHCDLHAGNWKVAVQSDGTYKLVIYDFGLTGSLGSMMKQTSLAMLGNSFIDMAKVIVVDWEHQPKWSQLANFVRDLESQTAKVYSDNYVAVMRKCMQIGIPVNLNVLRIMQGAHMCMAVVNVTRDGLNKMIGRAGDCTSVMLCYNIGLMEKFNKYKKLHQVMLQWIEEDPSIRETYENWLEETYGHKDGSIFVDITVDGLVF